FAVGVVELNRATDPTRVEAGDMIVALASSGVHSNGYAPVRKIIERKKLKLDKGYGELGSAPPREPLLPPTRISSPPTVKLLASYQRKKVVSGMAHITGGGLPGNVCRALPEDLDALLDLSTWEPPPIFDFLQRHGDIPTQEMFDVFNMGIGYVLIVRP